MTTRRAHRGNLAAWPSIVPSINQNWSPVKGLNWDVRLQINAGAENRVGPTSRSKPELVGRHAENVSPATTEMVSLKVEPCVFGVTLICFDLPGWSLYRVPCHTFLMQYLRLQREMNSKPPSFFWFCAKWSARGLCSDIAWKAHTHQPGARESMNADERCPRWSRIMNPAMISPHESCDFAPNGVTTTQPEATPQVWNQRTRQAPTGRHKFMIDERMRS